MPTYDYLCDACEHEFELFQSINDSIKKKCPECGKLKLRRLFGTGGAIVFKGSGFYQTDYRSESYKQGAAKEKKRTDKASESKSEKKSGTSDSSSSGGTKPKSDASKSKGGSGK